MELVSEADNLSAPRLDDVDLSAEDARECHRIVVRQVVLMQCSGLSHGDLSACDVLIGPDSPIVTDFPQLVSAAGNNAASTMLLRDVNNLTAYLGRSAPDMLETWYGEEMWALFQAGELRPDTELTGHFEPDESEVDLESIRQSINDARKNTSFGSRGARLRKRTEGRAGDEYNQSAFAPELTLRHERYCAAWDE